jgi:hypothetical protein
MSEEWTIDLDDVTIHVIAIKVKNPGPQDLVLPLPPERGLSRFPCSPSAYWSNGKKPNTKTFRIARLFLSKT